jgi:hypothetical protein
MAEIFGSAAVIIIVAAPIPICYLPTKATIVISAPPFLVLLASAATIVVVSVLVFGPSRSPAPDDYAFRLLVFVAVAMTVPVNPTGSRIGRKPIPWPSFGVPPGRVPRSVRISACAVSAAALSSNG